MAIDTTMLAVNVPAGTYAAGTRLPMSVIRGPSVVRDGYGVAKMKRVMTLEDGNSQPVGIVHIKNSNWIDEIVNFAISSSSVTLADNSPAIQRCGDVELQPNSSWDVYYEVRSAVTTTSDCTIYTLIDVDYPSVGAVADPRNQDGTPVTMYEEYAITSTLDGNGTNLVWTDYSVDIFKAGYRYLLAQVGARATITGGHCGFFSIHGAAGMSGLERIIPFVPATIGALRFGLDYSTPLVKGPMVISIAAVGTVAAESGLAMLELDFIRR